MACWKATTVISEVDSEMKVSDHSLTKESLTRTSHDWAQGQRENGLGRMDEIDSAPFPTLRMLVD